MRRQDSGPEYKLAEKPVIAELEKLGYKSLDPKLHTENRDGDNNVILRPVFLEAVQRINGVDEETARSIYSEILTKSDNEEWTELLRGNYSKSVKGEKDNKTIRLIDFENTENNTFTVTRQYTVRAEVNRRIDIVVFVNGIPLVVVEAKSPLCLKDKSGEAFEQIKQYERDVPRLFYSNLFNIITDGIALLYGATGAPAEYWSFWRDPFPKEVEEFKGDEVAKGLYALLEPERLLEILAHFVVFERETDEENITRVIKKVCRYQQYRAVQKIFDRIEEGEHKKGLIWHTQGSGKSLTMVFAALKIKLHRTSKDPRLPNPNILVLTDRIDLDTQISGTFENCGVRNPVHVGSVRDLQQLIRGQSAGITAISTIFKFEGSKKPLECSENWVLLVDECHRTQEKDLGAYLRATFPDATFFGFTGTPIKKNDKDTYQNFGATGEGYLDHYGIDDAVADGATVKIHATGRATEWHVDPKKIDVLFDQWFAGESEEKIREIKKHGVTVSDLAKHPERVSLIAFDIWTHFKGYAFKDGFKAQVVAIDREAVILYKRALNKVIAEDLMKDGMSEDEALKEADLMSACVYSANQSDDKPSADEYVREIRKDLQRYYLDSDQEKDVKKLFKKPGINPRFLIVCNKLLTGFDAPVESVMYLDNPLKDHNLLQAIARTNRTARGKTHGLIVDYIGAATNLDEALSAYRTEDVVNALRDDDELKENLKAAHREVMALTKGVACDTGNVRGEYLELIQVLGTEDVWYTFYNKARGFIAAYSAISPDPYILGYTKDLKWVAGFLPFGTQRFEGRESFDLQNYSHKIRAMLTEHLEVTGLRTTYKLKRLTDPDFYDDFKREQSAEDLEVAAIRKGAELKKTCTDHEDKNPVRYGPFSKLLLQAIKKFQAQQLTAAEAMAEYEQIAKKIEAEAKAYKGSGMEEEVYDLYKILELNSERSGVEGEAVREGAALYGVNLQELACEFAGLYRADESAPKGWHVKEQLKKELRQKVRLKAHASGFKNIKELCAQIEDYALKHFIKV